MNQIDNLPTLSEEELAQVAGGGGTDTWGNVPPEPPAGP